MNKKIIVGFLALVLLASSVYITLDDKVRIRVDNDKTTFYVPHEDYSWIWTVSGREYNSLFDGTSKMNRDSSSINVTTEINNETNEIWIYRHTEYIRGPIIKDTYYFKGDINKKELFPIYHKVEIINGSGFFYRYEVRNLEYNGETKKLEINEMSFGKNMKVEWQEEDKRWAWVYKSGILKVQYDIKSDYEKFNVRLFDPASSYNISFVPPTPANDTTTSDTSVEINVSITDGSDLKEVIYNWNGTNYSMYNDSLVLMMNFDNVSALGENDTHVFDVSGNGNNGTPTNGAHVNTTDCKFGNCFTFDGSNDRVLIDDDASLNFGNFTDFTLESWIKTSSTGYQYIFWKGQQQNGRWYGVRVDSPTGRISAFIDDAATELLSNGVTSVGDGNWHYVVVTYDRDGDMTVYLDGVQEGNPTEISSINNITNTLELGIGAGRVFGGAWGDFEFDGEIDEARVYNRILSADEITQNYMLNLNKYDTDKWLLYVNQSKNTTAGLDNGTYTYQTFASDTSDNWNQTDLRFINIGPAPDNPPTWSNNQTNGTQIGGYIEHSVLWADDINLNGYFFEFDNGTGNLNNDSFAVFPASNWSNVSKVVNTTVGSTIRWRVFANDSTNQFSATDIFTYDTTSVDTCNPGSPLISNYLFTCSDNCMHSSNLDAGGYNITFDSTGGTFTLQANITNYDKIFIIKPSSCNISFDGGKLIK